MSDYKHNLYYAIILASTAFIMCGVYTGFAFGMEAWAQSFTDLYIDDTKIDTYGNEYPNCTNIKYENATYNLYVKYDCYKIDNRVDLNCTQYCENVNKSDDDEGGGDPGPMTYRNVNGNNVNENKKRSNKVIYMRNNERIREKIYHRCFIINIITDDTDKNVYLNECYLSMNVTKIMSVVPANEHAGWTWAYVLISMLIIILFISLLCGVVYTSCKYIDDKDIWLSITRNDIRNDIRNNIQDNTSNNTSNDIRNNTRNGTQNDIELNNRANNRESNIPQEPGPKY